MKKIILSFIFVACVFAARANEFADVESYDVESSMFQRIADLEQEKVLMQLERDRAQLQLDLDRLAAEKARLAREQDNADMRAEEQAAEIERQRLAIDQERQKLDEQKKKMAEDAARSKAAKEDDDEQPAKKGIAAAAESKESESEKTLADRYSLVEIIGAGNQLVATVENIGTGKQRKVSVGRTLDGYSVRSISIDDGVEFEKDGEVVVIGIGSGRGGASGD